MAKLTRESKIKLLENFYGLDYALFGKPVSEVDTCCPIFTEEYMSIKGALLSVIIEMYKLIEYTPKVLTEKVDQRKLRLESKNKALASRKAAKKLVASENGRAFVKRKVLDSLQEGEKVDPAILVQENIRRKAYSLTVDNMLIGSAITESKEYQKLDEWSGKILEDAYKILRDQLVESAMTMLENGDSE